MSIATEIQTLQANKAAIKAAIEARNPSVAPTEVMSNWPASIASIGQKPYDAEIEYLESTGTQTIDIGIIPTPDTGFSIKFRPTNHSSFAFASPGSGWSDTYALYIGTGSPYPVNLHLPPNASQRSGSSNALNRDITVMLFNGYLDIDGRAYTLGTFTQSLPTSIKVFTASTATSGLRLYYLQFKDPLTDTDMFLIPVRVGQTGCLYDKVSHSLFYSNIGDPFVLGPDKT